MASFSMAEVNRLREKVGRMSKSTAKMREKAGEVVTDLVRAAEVAGVAAAIGYIQGKRSKDGKGALAFFGVPADLAVGVAGHVLAIAGVGGAEEHFKAIGDGGLATYFSTLGFTAGKTGSLPRMVSGELSPGSSQVAGQSLTPADLAKLAQG